MTETSTRMSRQQIEAFLDPPAACHRRCSASGREIPAEPHLVFVRRVPLLLFCIHPRRPPRRLSSHVAHHCA